MGLWEALGNVLGLMHDDPLHPPEKSLGESTCCRFFKSFQTKIINFTKKKKKKFLIFYCTKAISRLQGVQEIFLREAVGNTAGGSRLIKRVRVQFVNSLFLFFFPIRLDGWWGCGFCSFVCLALAPL